VNKDRKAIRDRIEAEEDFIYCPRLGNSVSRLLDKNPEGISDDRIIKVLLLDGEKELTELYESAINKLKANLGVGRGRLN